MQMTIVLPDEIGKRVLQLPKPDEFIANVLAEALSVRSVRSEAVATEKPSRWARLAQRVAEDPVHLDGYSEQLERDAREFREGFVFQHDHES